MQWHFLLLLLLLGLLSANGFAGYVACDVSPIMLLPSCCTAAVQLLPWILVLFAVLCCVDLLLSVLN